MFNAFAAHHQGQHLAGRLRRTSSAGDLVAHQPDLVDGLGEPAALLAATIQSIDGTSTGNATVGLRAAERLAAAAFARYGLRAVARGTGSAPPPSTPATQATEALQWA